MNIIDSVSKKCCSASCYGGKGAVDQALLMAKLLYLFPQTCDTDDVEDVEIAVDNPAFMDEFFDQVVPWNIVSIHKNTFFITHDSTLRGMMWLVDEELFFFGVGGMMETLKKLATDLNVSHSCLTP